VVKYVDAAEVRIVVAAVLAAAAEPGHVPLFVCVWGPSFLAELIDITGFICAVVRYPSRRCTFGEFEFLAVSLRRCWRMFQKPLRRMRLRHKTSAWASSGPAESRRVAACFGRWHALPLRGPPRRVERPRFRLYMLFDKNSRRIFNLAKSTIVLNPPEV
jgi:hypothetical protein